MFSPTPNGMGPKLNKSTRFFNMLYSSTDFGQRHDVVVAFIHGSSRVVVCHQFPAASYGVVKEVVYVIPSTIVAFHNVGLETLLIRIIPQFPEVGCVRLHT